MSFNQDLPHAHARMSGSMQANPPPADQPADNPYVGKTALPEDDAVPAKAATIRVDLREFQETYEQESSAKGSPFYIQGIVQNHKAFIITNLPEGESHTLVQPQMVWTLGRHREAAIALPDKAMSRHHAVLLYVADAGFQFMDLNSMNGSFLNGKRLQQRTFLRDGDHLRMGMTEFTFYFSRSIQTLEPLHPEVLSRLNSSKPRPDSNFVDFSALDESEIEFNLPR